MYCRFLTTNDFSQFRELRLEALQSDPFAFATTYEIEKELPDDKFIQRLKHNDTQFVVGGFDGSTLVCIASFRKYTGAKVQHKGMLLAMYCKKSYRGTGVAKDLVKYLITYVKKLEGVEFLHLMVLSKNARAKKFYSQLGFVKYGTEPYALFDGENYHDEDLMVLDLSQAP